MWFLPGFRASKCRKGARFASFCDGDVYDNLARTGVAEHDRRRIVIHSKLYRFFTNLHRQVRRSISFVSPLILLRSPDVSSPLGLAALPSISPPATTPIERPRSLRSGTFDLPEAQGALPESSSGRTSASRDLDVDTETIDTVVHSEVVSLDDSASITTVKPLVHVQSPIAGHITPHTVDLGLEDDSSKTMISCPTSTNLVSNAQLPYIQTFAGKLLLLRLGG